jgi:Cys-rich protein (TIGR01571 family)
MKELDKVEVIVPVGEWRDDLCDVCSFGPCHPVLLNSFFFPHISLGQIMGRSSLDYIGHEGSGFLPRESCMALAVITYSVWFIDLMLIGWGVSEYFMYNEYIPRVAIWIPFAVLNAFYITFIWYAICSTRNTLRSRYMIPERRCYKCEDICCATFCAPCSIAQMNRHTGDFNTFRALCCSATGMPRHVAVPVNPDAKQVYDYAGPNMV